MTKRWMLQLGFLLLPAVTRAAEFSLPSGRAWDATRLASLFTDIANWLIAIGLVGAVIALVSSGILYFTSGFNAKAVDKAKELFKYGLTGTLIILAVGVIINTIGILVAGQFFNPTQ